MGLIKKIIKWYEKNGATDPIRSVLNRGFSWIILVFIATLVAALLAVPYPPFAYIIIAVVFILILVAWYFNRRGSSHGAFILCVVTSVVSVVFLDTSNMNTGTNSISILFLLGPFIAIAFIHPWSGIWSFWLQLFIISASLYIRGINSDVAMPYLVRTAIDLTLMCSVLAIRTSLFRDSLRKAYEAEAALALAYDQALDGWAKALELRNKETRGHSERVTNMTARLAKEMGVSNGELKDIWRGALLHDIGKTGIPDSILLKPGPLTEMEWDVMKMHPIYAYEWLSPIPPLKNALEIPYCHHERWDGGGYPRGLRGKEIPLSARIFAVVDTWDALRSKRPYHEAMPEDEVRAHIKSLSGTAFDPEVVRIFLSKEFN